MTNREHWLSRRADEEIIAPPPAMKPLEELDRARTPSPAQPTAAPQPAEPIPMNELLKLFEQAAKALYDAGLDMQKASVAIHKITSSGGRTAAERGVISKAEAMISQIESAQDVVGKIADSVSEFRGSLGENTAASSAWVVGK